MRLHHSRLLSRARHMPRLEVTRRRVFDRVYALDGCWKASVKIPQHLVTHSERLVNRFSEHSANRFKRSQEALSKLGRRLERTLAWSYMFAQFFFIIDSVLFLPSLGRACLRAGCSLYLVGSIMLTAVAIFDLAEAYVASIDDPETPTMHGVNRYELTIQAMNLIGSLCFTIGTVYFFPDVSASTHLQGQETGVALFIGGSVLFVLACFGNGMLNVEVGGSTVGMTALFRTNTSMLGMVCFVVGSVGSAAPLCYPASPYLQWARCCSGVHTLRPCDFHPHLWIRC